MENYIVVGASNVEVYIEIMQELGIPPLSLHFGIPEDIIYKVNEEAIKRNVSILAMPLSLIKEIRERIEKEMDSDDIDIRDDMEQVVMEGPKLIFKTLLDKKPGGAGILLPYYLEEEIVVEKGNEDCGSITDNDILDLQIALNTMSSGDFINSL